MKEQPGQSQLQRPSGQDGEAREFLTFRLGAESYGIEILKVQEIRGYEKPTTIANAPAFIKGVINLRGVIVPILDLRIKFQLGEAKYDEFTVVIILNVAGRMVGVVVDAVSDVVALSARKHPADARNSPPPCSIRSTSPAWARSTSRC